MSTQKRPRTILNFTEGEALQMLEALLVAEQKSFPKLALKLEVPTEALMSAVKDRLAKAAVRFLFVGANKENIVLRQGLSQVGQRVEGRLWDPHLNEGFELHFTEGSYLFWLGACRQFALLGSLDGSGRQKKKLVRGVIADDSTPLTDTGDWIFFYLVYLGIEKYGLALDPLQAIIKRLRAASPLLNLFVLERDAIEGDIIRTLRLLTKPSAIRILECIEDRLVASWEAELSQLYAQSATAEQLTQRWSNVTRVLRAYLDALNEVGRLDLSLSVLRLMLALQKKAFSQGPSAVRARVASLGGVKNLQQRDSVVNAIASCLSLATWIYQQRDLLAAQRYGDERYQEAQLFVRKVDVFSGSRVEIDTLTRALSGIIG
jgi:hypothetical protein